ncbi:MAG: hypothetical protein WD688_08275 [Candidatus Binatia bacterium]
MKGRTLVFLGCLLFSGMGGYSEIVEAADSEMTKTISGGGVTAKVTYLNPKDNNDEPRFQIVLDTHSANLDAYDLKTITALRDDTGKTYLATGIENKGSGHHREATLTFPKVSPESKRFEVIIKDVAGVKERAFRWNLQ